METNPSKNIVDLRSKNPLRPVEATRPSQEHGAPQRTEAQPQLQETVSPPARPTAQEHHAIAEPPIPPQASAPEPKNTEPEPLIIEHEDALISWLAPEYPYYEKNKNTWIPAILVGAAVLALIFGFVFKSYSSVLITAVGAVTLLVSAFRKPRLITFSITPRGVFAGRKFYPFDAMASFWIFYDPPVIKELSFRQKQALFPAILFPITDQDPIGLRELLLEYLKEEEQHISFFDSLARRLGF